MPEVSWTKAEALAALEEEYRKTLRAVQDYADEDYGVSRGESIMSPKDTFAHLAWWNWEAPSGLQRIKRDEMPFWVHMDLDELNAGTLAERKDWPLQRVMEDFRRSHTALVAALEQVTDEEFNHVTHTSIATGHLTEWSGLPSSTSSTTRHRAHLADNRTS